MPDLSKFIADAIKKVKAGTAKPEAQAEVPNRPTVEQPNPAAKTEPPSQTDHPTRRALEERLYRLGYDTARESGVIDVDEPLLKALEAKAIAEALVVYRAPSDARDQRRLTQLKTLEETFKRRTVDRDRAAVESAVAHKRLAALGTRLPRPSVSAVFKHAATLALTVSIAPTFHDLLAGFDPFLKWIVAGVCAWGVSLLLVHGILPAPPGPNSSTGGKNQ
jgi:hypothetical protein